MVQELRRWGTAQGGGPKMSRRVLVGLVLVALLGLAAPSPAHAVAPFTRVLSGQITSGTEHYPFSGAFACPLTGNPAHPCDTLITAVSDANGNYTMMVDPSRQYYVGGVADG